MPFAAHHVLGGLAVPLGLPFLLAGGLHGVAGRLGVWHDGRVTKRQRLGETAVIPTACSPAAIGRSVTASQLSKG